MSKEAKISELIPDDKNFNRGTEFGNSLIEKSLRKFGAGRSILIDKNNRIIAGNKTIENANAIGLEDIIIVETTGDKIVAVKRTDIDLDTAQGRELALADNATAYNNIEWDNVALEALKFDLDIDSKDWGIDPDKFKLSDSEEVTSLKGTEITITLKFPPERGLTVQSQLQSFGKPAEEVIWQLLGNR